MDDEWGLFFEDEGECAVPCTFRRGVHLRKNEEKVVGVKPDTDMNCVVQIVVVIIMTDK
jgi:hypothetical protein